jgi:MFS family permease
MSRGRRRPAWLTANLLVLTLVSLTQDAASELLYPLLPLLITGVLAAPPVVLGVVEGVADATAGLTRYLTGRWSDRRGRVPFIGAGYGLAAVGKVLVAAATAWPLVLVGRTVDRFGKGVRSAPRDALIASSVPPESLGRAFGFHRTGDTLGAVVGPLLGLWALAVMDDDLHAALWWAVVPASISVLLVLLVREPARPGHGAAETVPPPTGAPAEPTSSRASPVVREEPPPLPRPYWTVTLTLAVISLVNFSDALVLLRLADMGFSPTEVVMAYVLFNAVYALGSYPAGVLTDRWSRPTIYAVGLLAFSLGYTGLALVDRGAPAYVLIACYGLFPALTDGVGKAWVASLVPADRLGRAHGVFQGLTSGAVLVAGIWAGLLWNAGPGSGVVPLLVSGLAGVAAAAVMAGRVGSVLRRAV